MYPDLGILKHCSILQYGAFSHSSANISEENSKDLHEYFIRDVSLDKEVPLNSWNLSVSGTDPPCALQVLLSKKLSSMG